MSKRNDRYLDENRLVDLHASFAREHGVIADLFHDSATPVGGLPSLLITLAWIQTGLADEQRP
jgi:hypothetical protein